MVVGMVDKLRGLLVGLRFLVLLSLALPLIGPTVAAVEREYVVVYAAAEQPQAARTALAAIGGRIVHENSRIGVVTVRSHNPWFADDVARQPALAGVVSRHVVGRVSGTFQSSTTFAGNQRLLPSTWPLQPSPAAAEAEPLSSLQWNMQMINAARAHRIEQGDKRVLVGVIDTGIDGSHPDIAPNFSRALSRNFVPDGDAVDVDEGGHGTHVAGTIAAPRNARGIVGVAPNVTLVNLRAGNDEGYFFLQPMVDALTYAADIGVDVVNMSLYIDPWLFNCPNNSADSIAAQREQQTIITATQRALDYARDRGVTLIAAAGNEHVDLDHPQTDTISPNFPKERAYPRKVDNSCLVLPAEGNGVVSVTSLGPSGRKAYYSSYGLEQADVAAPGGDGHDFPGTPRYRRAENLILAPYPEAVLRAEGALQDNGAPVEPDVVRDCQPDQCTYYRYLQGTSMAAPHVAGVAALVISRFGEPDPVHADGITMEPARVEWVLQSRASNRLCPRGGTLAYPDLPERFTASCEGQRSQNGFYGSGIVDARNAVLRPGRTWGGELTDVDITP